MILGHEPVVPQVALFLIVAEVLELRDSHTEKIWAHAIAVADEVVAAEAAAAEAAAAEAVSGSIALIAAELVELRECNT